MCRSLFGYCVPAIAFQRVADDSDAEVADAALAVVADDTIADQMVAHDRG